MCRSHSINGNVAEFIDKKMQKSRAILLLNLGSPDAPTVPAVRKYLREFLGDRHVISLPWIFRKILLECFILPGRPKKSAALYKRIWTSSGSPLIRETEKLRERLAEKLCGKAKVFCAMRYGNPGVKNVLQKIMAFLMATTKLANNSAMFPKF